MIRIPIIVLSDLLFKVGLAYRKDIDVSKVGVYPGNREGIGFILSAVIEMTETLMADGYAKDLVNAWVSELPPNENGESWRAFNKQLWDDSDGYLASSNPSELENITVRGSHTTSSVRNVKLRARDPITGKGRINAGAILEKNPTLREPLEAMPYCVHLKRIVHET